MISFTTLLKIILHDIAVVAVGLGVAVKPFS
jgi:hypothetical protein